MSAVECSTVTLTQAAARLRRSYNQVLRCVLLGELPGHQDDRGRWHVEASALPAPSTGSP